jgi:hypothetical protein
MTHQTKRGSREPRIPEDAMSTKAVRQEAGPNVTPPQTLCSQPEVAMAKACPSPPPDSMKPEMIAEEISAAFAELVREESRLLEQFEETYEERGTIPGLVETHEGTEGLTETLAGLLGMFPEEPHEGLRATSHVGAVGDLRIDGFGKMFFDAVHALIREHPSTLILFKKHQLADPRTIRDFLAALLRMYAKHEVGYPY